jgi:hypothetical protein
VSVETGGRETGMRELLLIGIPGLMLSVGLFAAVRSILSQWRCATVSGVVHSFEKINDTDGDRYRAVVAYTVDGRDHTFVDAFAMSWTAEQIGKLVIVCYLPEDPAIAHIRRRWTHWAFVGIAALGGMFLTLGIIEYGKP